MIYAIAAIKAKINDTKDSVELDIRVNGDDGESCIIAYAIRPYSGGNPLSVISDKNGTSGVFVIKSNYSEYNQAEDRVRWAADFVCVNVSPTLTIV